MRISNISTILSFLAVWHAAFNLCFAAPALASDWGYEETEPVSGESTSSSVEELQAVPGALGGELPTSAKSPSAKSPDIMRSTPEPVDQVDKRINSSKNANLGAGGPKMSIPGKFKQPPKGTAEYAWLQLLGLVAPLPSSQDLPAGPDYSGTLSAEQKKRFLSFFEKERKSGDKSGYSNLSNYWSDLERAFKVEDHKGNYRLLFRSLLRMKTESQGISEEEKAILSEALGPKRLAVPGDPALSEDAIKAYSDMACFLFEQKNPGKTVDADDNRKLFGLVIRDKFKKAPAYADKLAMCYFPINWAKFRILYTDASEEERSILVKKLSGAKNNSSSSVSNPLLEKVLSLEPWKTVLVRANRLTKPVGHRPAVGALKLGSSKP